MRNLFRTLRNRFVFPSFLALAAAVFCAALLCAPEAGAVSANDGFDPNANGTVKAIAIQPDGKIVIGGMGSPRPKRVDFVSAGRLNSSLLPFSSVEL